jgi:hypothetical protein
MLRRLFSKKLYDEGKFIEQETDQYYDEEVRSSPFAEPVDSKAPVLSVAMHERLNGNQGECGGSSLQNPSAGSDLINPHSSAINVLETGTQENQRKTWFLPREKLQPKDTRLSGGITRLEVKRIRSMQELAGDRRRPATPLDDVLHLQHWVCRYR